MANWAQIDDDSIVVNVVHMNNNHIDGDEGYQWLVDRLGGNWVKTSYNTIAGTHHLPDTQRDENGNLILSGQPHLRYNYAGIGFTYDEQRDAFIPPKPTEGNWILNEDTCQWEIAP